MLVLRISVCTLILLSVWACIFVTYTLPWWDSPVVNALLPGSRFIALAFFLVVLIWLEMLLLLHTLFPKFEAGPSPLIRFHQTNARKGRNQEAPSVKLAKDAWTRARDAQVYWFVPVLLIVVVGLPVLYWYSHDLHFWTTHRPTVGTFQAGNWASTTASLGPSSHIFIPPGENWYRFNNTFILGNLAVWGTYTTGGRYATTMIEFVAPLLFLTPEQARDNASHFVWNASDPEHKKIPRAWISRTFGFGDVEEYHPHYPIWDLVWDSPTTLHEGALVAEGPSGMSIFYFFL